MIHALRTRVHGQMRDACQAPGSCPWHATQGIAPIRHRSAVWRACNEAARGQRSHPLRNLPTSQAAVPPPTPVVRGRPCTCLTPLILPPPFSLRPHHPQAQASSSIECNAAGHRAHGAGRRATLARQRAFPTGLRDMPADAAEQLRRQRAASCRGADAPCSKSPLKRNVAGPCVQLEMGAWGRFLIRTGSSRSPWDASLRHCGSRSARRGTAKVRPFGGCCVDGHAGGPASPGLD